MDMSSSTGGHENYVDFEVSMGKGTCYFNLIERLKGDNIEIYKKFKSLYIKNNFLEVKMNDVPKTPKIIHQIWIGDRDIPKELKESTSSWKEMHPDWEYIFWDNEKVKNYKFAHKKLEKLFQEPLTMGEMTDILRYDILYQYGGLYVDCDTNCFKSFNDLVCRYDFFASIYHVGEQDKEPLPVGVQNCLIGSKAKHPILEALGNIVYDNWNQISSGPEDLDDVALTMGRTFLTLTHGVLEGVDLGDNVDILMPPTYFLPVNPHRVKDFYLRGFYAGILGLFIKKYAPYSHVHEHSYSNHYSAKEWLGNLHSKLKFNKEMFLHFNIKNYLEFFSSQVSKEKKEKQAGRGRITFNELFDIKEKNKLSNSMNMIE